MATEEQRKYRGKGDKKSPQPKGITVRAPKLSRDGQRSLRVPNTPTGKAPKGRAINTGGSERTRTDAARKKVPVTKQAGGVDIRTPKLEQHEGQTDIAAPYVPVAGQEPEGRELDQFRHRDPERGGDMPLEDESQFISQDDEWHYSEIADHDGDISELLTDTEITKLGMDVLREFKIDDDSRSEAITAYDKAMEDARAETKTKSYPFDKAANTKYPLLQVAALQFAARAYPAIVKGNDIVKCRVNGKDDEQGSKGQRAQRISEHMSFQLTEEQKEWESQIDTMLHHLPLAGTAFRCIYYDDELGRNTTEQVNMKDFVINNEAKSLADCPRFTRVREYYPYEIREKMRSGFYRSVEGLFDTTDTDTQEAQAVYEQHCRHDLDGDGYEEPYVVTVHMESQQVLRVVPSADIDTILVDEDEDGLFIKKALHEPMYVRYIFMPDPEGKMYGLGFGKLLESVSAAINSTLNQILDAAHLQNGGGGFLGGNVNFGKKRELRMRPGHWQQLQSHGSDIRQAIVPHNWPGPSPVLFQVLGLLVEMGKEIGSIKDVLSGEASSANMPVGTTMALIEQGLQQFTAIYKRIYRSLREEYQLLYRLNSLYLPDESYFQLFDDERAVARSDYAMGDYDVSPVSDPTAVTTMQKMAKVEFALQFKGQPHVNDEAIDRRAMEAANLADLDELFNKPDPAMQQQQMAMAQLEMRRIEAEVAALEMKVPLTQGQTIKALADAEATETKTEIAEADSVLNAMKLGREMAGIHDEPEQASNPNLAA